MKRTLFFLLALTLLLSSCGKLEAVEEAAPTATTEEGEAETVEKAVEYPVIRNPLTWEKIDAIPIANSEMTEDELRKICVDYMRLELSFEWTPDRTHAYKIETEMHNNKPMTFSLGTVYVGIPYRAGSNNGQSGNLYTFMERYDPETGVLSSEGLTTDQLTSLITNHCSSSAYWAWARVVNTMFGASDDLSKSGLSNANMTRGRGFLPVGPYTYSGVNSWSEGDGTRAVCEANGEQVMYRSYAELHPADGCIQLYPKGTTNANHVQMICAEPEISYLPDGSIDGENSYVTILEQTSTLKETLRVDGVKVYVEGGIDRRVSFKRMYDASYIPFTFAEFQGTDPVEDLEIRLTGRDGKAVETLGDLRNASFGANYAISDITTTATDPSGKVVYTRAAHPSKTGTFSYELYLAISQTAETQEKKGNAVEITARLGNGQQVTLYKDKQVLPQ